MKYLLLAYGDQETWDKLDVTSPEFLAACKFYEDLAAELTGTGELLGTERARASRAGPDGTTLRRRAGRQRGAVRGVQGGAGQFRRRGLRQPRPGDGHRGQDRRGGRRHGRGPPDHGRSGRLTMEQLWRDLTLCRPATSARAGLRRRRLAAAVPVLSSGAVDGVPASPDAAGGRRSQHGRDRRRPADPGGHDRPADQPSQAQAPGRAVPATGRSPGAAHRHDPGPVSDLQRGLPRHLR